MSHWLALLCLVGLAFTACAVGPLASLAPSAESIQATEAKVAGSPTASELCAETPTVRAEPPDDPNADPFGFGPWVVNADRTIWVGVRTDGGWRTGGEKVLWIRPAGTELVVTGQRLDGDAPPLRAEIPCCYLTGFQTTGLYFPSEGCWEVAANAGAHKLRFVTRVTEASQTNQGSGEHDLRLEGAVLLRSCTEHDCRLHLIDPTTGQDVPGRAPIDLGSYAQYAFAHDRRTLALLVYEPEGPGNEYINGNLRFVDLAAWRTTTTTLTFNSIANEITFSPDDRRLWVVADQSSWPPTRHGNLVDVERGILLAEQPLAILPTQAAFTPDGGQVMLFGTDQGSPESGLNPSAMVALLDADTLSVIWQQTIPGLRNGQYADDPLTDPHNTIWWEPAAVFAPNQATLYIVHADDDQLSTVDFSQRTVQTRPIGQPQSWVERLLALTARTAQAKLLHGASRQAAISADGSQLFVSGLRRSLTDGRYTETPLGVQVIDLASSVAIAQIDTQTQRLSLSPDGSRLYLQGWQQQRGASPAAAWTEVFDAQSRQPITRLEGRSVFATRRLDGQPILLSQMMAPNGQTELATLDPATLQVIHSWQESEQGYVGWWAPPD